MPHKLAKPAARRQKPIPNIQFLKSAVFPQDYPPDGLPEVCIVGRSNAGKSSLINAIYNAKLAKVSSAPGKTRLINFFEVPKKYRLVDLPGYGFAARSESERVSWRSSVETYLAIRANLVGVLLVMDTRREWQLEETDLLTWLRPRQLPWLLILSKSDKLTKSQIQQQSARILKQIKAEGLPMPGEIFACSALKRSNVRDVEEHFFKHWVNKRSQQI